MPASPAGTLLGAPTMYFPVAPRHVEQERSLPLRAGVSTVEFDVPALGRVGSVSSGAEQSVALLKTMARHDDELLERARI